MAAANKILWVVGYQNLDKFVERAKDIGATGVAIRTDNDLAKAIPKFHAQNIKVFGWRWPSAKQAGAMQEAARAVAFLGQGMDGYYVDPEGEKGKSYDWDLAGLAPIADAFCKTIRDAAPDKPFGTTSHYRAKAVFPKLPWAAFFAHSTVLLPQAYWRASFGKIGQGPAANYRTSIDLWEQAGGARDTIVPMAGELAVATAAEIKAHADEAAAQGRDTLHYYTYTNSVPDEVWAAVKAS